MSFIEPKKKQTSLFSIQKEETKEDLHSSLFSHMEKSSSLFLISGMNSELKPLKPKSSFDAISNQTKASTNTSGSSHPLFNLETPKVQNVQQSIGKMYGFTPIISEGPAPGCDKDGFKNG